jgi:31-O-methyltransferase
VTTISPVMAAEAVDEIALLKVDVEGAELAMLEGITSSDWGRIRQVTVEVHSAVALSPIVALLETNGFDYDIDQDPSLSGTDMRILAATRLASTPTRVATLVAADRGARVPAAGGETAR